MKKIIKYIDRRNNPPGSGFGIIFLKEISDILEEERKKGFIVDNIIQTERGDFYILIKK